MKNQDDLGRLVSQMASRIKLDLDRAEAPVRAMLAKAQKDMEPFHAVGKETARQVKQFQAMQRELSKATEPFRAQFARIDADMRRHNEAIQKAIRGSGIDFEAIARAMEEDRARFPGEMKVLAQHGWYVQPRMTPRQHRELCAALTAGRADEVEKALIEHFDGELDAIEAELCKHSPTRERLLRSAFAAHRRGDFATSIPLMLAQADGLCRDYTGGHLFSRRERLEAWIKAGKPSLLMCFAALVERTPVNAAEKDRAGKVALFNRHAIMHGESVDYDTAGNGARAVSLLVYVDWVLGEISHLRRRNGSK